MTDKLDDLFKQAEEAGDEDRWDFEETPEIRGVLFGVGTGPDVGYGKFHILRIKEQKTEKTFNVAVFGIVFHNKVQDLAPKIGFPIGIRDQGMQTNKAGDREYHGWLVVSDEPDHAFWAEQIAGLQSAGGSRQGGGDKAEPVGDFF